MRKLFCLLFIFTMVVCFSRLSRAGEHPGEYPKEPSKNEHPGEKAMLSGAQIIKGIKEHINSVTENNNGSFPLYDSKDNKSLRLKLMRVHEDRVSYIKKESAYFACTDFMSDDGKTAYDVDFWMKEGQGEKLEVYQTKIHKKDGVPRFTYQDDEVVGVDIILEKKGSGMVENEDSGTMEKKGS